MKHIITIAFVLGLAACADGPPSDTSSSDQAAALLILGGLNGVNQGLGYTRPPVAQTFCTPAVAGKPEFGLSCSPAFGR